jgi:hypothetical protein
MKTSLAGFLVVLLLAPLPLLAHHSFAAEFDSSKPVTVKGAVSKVEWTNPHIWIYVDTKDESGAVAKWECEMGSPNSLMRQGWRADSLKQGDQITIEGTRAKNGTNTCNARTVRLADGTRLFAGSSEGTRP